MWKDNLVNLMWLCVNVTFCKLVSLRRLTCAVLFTKSLTRKVSQLKYYHGLGKLNEDILTTSIFELDQQGVRYVYISIKSSSLDHKKKKKTIEKRIMEKTIVKKDYKYMHPPQRQ